MPSHHDYIRLRGVRQNNLKGFDLDLPIGQLTVVTGLSGAGKSSLVFETLHAEGQRRYVETFSPYTRQFMELLDRPDVDSVENIRPSIAIQQSNTVKTSRSTVGTITELCDYFKVWFANAATLYDPATGKAIRDDKPQNIWKSLLKDFSEESILVCFSVEKPGKLKWSEIIKALSGQGYTRAIHAKQVVRLEELKISKLKAKDQLHIIQDRLKVNTSARSRFIEAAHQTFAFGKGRMQIFDLNARQLTAFTQGLNSPKTGESFRPATPALFSFNSPIGACPSCRGFGRVIEIDYDLVIPDQSLSIDDGAIRAFQGEVYSESLRDLQRAAQHHKVRTNVPYGELTTREKNFIIEGEKDYEDGSYHNRWYGVRRFFGWLESNVYKMHVRVFLSKFRSYSRCPDCQGARLQPEALNWKWQGHTLPDLYGKSVNELIALLHRANTQKAATGNTALSGILSRLSFLDQVGLGYLALDRSSRTLSGGETMRVNLTSCLGSALTDTLFVLDEPSVGLHSRDMDRLISILRRLTNLGNTVVVVEHDEAVMRAADNLIEIGPKPGVNGGQLTFHGNYDRILKSDTQTGRFLSGREQIDVPKKRRPCIQEPTTNHSTTSSRRSIAKADQPPTTNYLSIYGASKHNIKELDLHLPQQQLVCLSGVSGSGKSTLLNNVIYQNLLVQKGLSADDPATLKDIESTLPLSEVVLVDQSPVSKTPRSNPALFSKAWDEIRKLFAKLDAARAAGMQPGHFSFNGGDGRCPTCSGLGYERIEMQFVSDLFVPCETCEGQRFKPEVLEIVYNGKSIAGILELDIDEAILFFGEHPKIVRALQPLIDVGLGYLKLGQPLNTLSGGESQRLKLVRYLGRISRPKRTRNDDHGVSKNSSHAMILIDEPTTGLHRADIKRLIKVLQSLVDSGHSVIVIEHNLDLLKVADWIVEMGPEAGDRGGRVIAEGTPEQVAKMKCETAPYLSEALGEGRGVVHQASAAESQARYNSVQGAKSDAKPSKLATLSVRGAREHNLRNISTDIPHNAITVVTGVSGSGKSSLAFDIVFAEGQRRFMESMSAYARQFVEQMPRADVDALDGIAPTVAIEQRVTRGTRKSTVATITEVAQYLRLLFARIGIQHSPISGEAVVTQSESALQKRLEILLKEYGSSSKNRQANAPLYLCAPLLRGRKGHHEPLANWARDHDYSMLRIDGQMVPLDQFQKLDRYREHDIDLVLEELSARQRTTAAIKQRSNAKLQEALRLGKGSALILNAQGEVLSWLSTKRTDPATGQAFPELDPKHFSWNSPRGWCPTCRGYGQLFDWMSSEEDSRIGHPDPNDYENGGTCPDCQGARINELSRAVRLPLKASRKVERSIPSAASTDSRLSAKTAPTVSLPELLSLTPSKLLTALKAVKTTKRTKPILDELLPEIEERMRFMDRVGLGYLELDRATATLSGGEAQRIRLAAQLGSNLSGVLYVLDEPSIGLHARDNERLIQSLEQLRDRGNTLLVVEHDADTMKHADKIIDLGPAAGIHGGEIVASGTLAQLKRNKASITGKYLRKSLSHPRRGEYRELPAPWSPRKKKDNQNWIVLQQAALRNLKGFDLMIPKNRLTAVCGVSGAGKSTLIRDLLKPLVDEAVNQKAEKLGPKHLSSSHPCASVSLSGSKKQSNRFKTLHHAHDIRKVIEVDQSPIGKTPRSTPATYIGAYDIIRQIYASLPEANMRGYTAGTFSFNTKGGRCENCKGAGRVKLEMNFMPDTYVTCEDCGGRRYGSELDELQWNGKSIADVLEMSFEEAAGFFSFHTQLSHLMQLMVETGLGYITLGQYSPTLSGGEAQRMKLVSELAKGQPSFKERQYNKGQGNLYILEEPTIGLHLSDVERLTELLHRLVDKGHSVIVIEHHLDVIQDADYVVEIGPDGGDAGGELLYQGNVAGLKSCKESATAQFL
ncbi:excinuclease ABC subunit A [Coraliomargarita sinensis]|uniref:UvrABC system protein A n=1 Tax=Coraliomargarita sinensis TaxID=2174842 RepID=A0A317ZED4_9BACT|nr:excinuclease ABC subunit UvrA [Coraliomargarita sinensis]PXA03082.1 excinuclease ABC subunit A [Coraliomargarita sinensis]